MSNPKLQVDKRYEGLLERRDGIYNFFRDGFNKLDAQLGKRGYWCQEVIPPRDVPCALRRLAREHPSRPDAILLLPVELVAVGFPEGSYAFYRQAIKTKKRS